MDASKMLALLGAMTVTAAAVPAVATVTKSDTGNQNPNGLVLYSGTQGAGHNVSWHTSHGSHTSHSSHSSSRY